MARSISRRRFLGSAGAMLAAGAVAPSVLAGKAAAVSSPAMPSPASVVGDPTAALRALGRSTLRLPGSRPNPHLAAGTDTLAGIDHIVVLMLENHSFDNLFGMLGRGDGFTLDASGQPTATNPYPAGRLQHALHMRSEE